MFRREIHDNLSKCNFISVLVDGSMDSAITDNEMVYVQYCQAGIVKTNFIYCCQVQWGTAPQILSAIQKAAETVMDWDHFKKKLVALASDGASVMLGKNNGVIALCHCMNFLTFYWCIWIHLDTHNLLYTQFIQHFSYFIFLTRFYKVYRNYTGILCNIFTIWVYT